MKVSFVTAAYNAADTIQRTVESVAGSAQNGFECEHVVVNDGSTDNTASLLRSLKAKHKHIVLLDQPNQGRSAARNAGLNSVTSDYVVFLDADDQIDESYLTVMGRAARTRPGSVIYCDWKEIDQTGTTANRTAHLSDDVFTETARRCPFALHSCLVPTKLARTVNGFDPSLSFAEDWDFWQKLGRMGVTFTHIPQTLATYHLRPRNVTSEAARKHYQSAIGVVVRTFTSDPRVVEPTSRYKNGLTAGSSLNGQSQIWSWFAGIEAGSDTTYSWLESDVAAIEATSADPRPTPNMLANAFVHGVWMARASRPLAATIDPYRLTYLADHLSIDDPDLLARRLLIPRDLPAELGDQIHLGLAIKPKRFQTQRSAGRIRFHNVPKGLPIPSGLYEAQGEDQISFNLCSGIVRAAQTTVTSRDVWIASQRLPAALTRDPRMIKSLARRFAERAVDQSVGDNFLNRKWEPSAEAVEPVENFEDIFTVEDPWRYGEPYEVRKYEETLELVKAIGDLKSKTVTEIGCAEGHFTLRLAPLVESLTAVDISPTALARTRKKLADAGICNTKTGEFDVRHDRVSSIQDLIVCSELLYYMSKDLLADAVDRLAGSLESGGYLVHAHAYEASERTGKPGFGWRQEFGAMTISAAFDASRDLQLDARIETDLYLVERFKKTHKRTHANVEFRRIERDQLEPEIERQVLWEGYGTKPDNQSNATRQLPVLCYHSVGEGAPAALRQYQIDVESLAEQLEWLRYNGYRSASVEEIIKLVRHGKPIPGKGVHLTFDDGYKDFDVNAWPALQAYGFSATLFVPTAHLGDSGVWDEMYGDPLPLLDQERLKQLSRQGLVVGSHFTQHQRITTLPTVDALAGLRRSKVVLQQITGQPVNQIAYPYGDNDSVIQRLARACGYETGYTTKSGFVRPFDRPLGLDRIVVDSTDELLDSLQRWPEPGPIGVYDRLVQTCTRQARSKAKQVRDVWWK